VQVEAIRFLVKAGCSPSVQDNVASTPLHIAAGEGHIEAIKVLGTLVRIGMQSHWLGCLSSDCCRIVSVTGTCPGFDQLGMVAWEDAT